MFPFQLYSWVWCNTENTSCMCEKYTWLLDTKHLMHLLCKYLIASVDIFYISLTVNINVRQQSNLFDIKNEVSQLKQKFWQPKMVLTECYVGYKNYVDVLL